MARLFSSPSAVATFFSSIVLVVAVGAFAYLQFAFLIPAASPVVASQYSISRVVTDMRQGGPYDQAQALIPAAGTSASTPTPAPVITSGDLGKSDLSKFNQ